MERIRIRRLALATVLGALTIIPVTAASAGSNASVPAAAANPSTRDASSGSAPTLMNPAISMTQTRKVEKFGPKASGLMKPKRCAKK